jgi:hypothetical protein
LLAVSRGLDVEHGGAAVLDAAVSSAPTLGSITVDVDSDSMCVVPALVVSNEQIAS